MFIRACQSYSASLSRSPSISSIGGFNRLSYVQFSLAISSLIGSLASRSISQLVTTFLSCLGEYSSLRGGQEKYIILQSKAVGRQLFNYSMLIIAKFDMLVISILAFTLVFSLYYLTHSFISNSYFSTLALTFRGSLNLFQPKQLLFTL